MHFLPFYIKKYSTSAQGDCIVGKIRANTVYQYNKDGYLRDYNPNGLLFRNEKDKGIFLKDQRDIKSKYGGGTTAIFIRDLDSGKTVITTIQYFGWQQSMILVLLLFGVIYNSLFNQKDAPILIGAFFLFNIFFALLSGKALDRQKKLVEKTIEHCEEGS